MTKDYQKHFLFFIKAIPLLIGLANNGDLCCSVKFVKAPYKTSFIDLK